MQEQYAITAALNSLANLAETMTSVSGFAPELIRHAAARIDATARDRRKIGGNGAKKSDWTAALKGDDVAICRQLASFCFPKQDKEQTANAIYRRNTIAVQTPYMHIPLTPKNRQAGLRAGVVLHLINSRNDRPARLDVLKQYALLVNGTNEGQWASVRSLGRLLDNGFGPHRKVRRKDQVALSYLAFFPETKDRDIVHLFTPDNVESARFFGAMILTDKDGGNG